MINQPDLDQPVTKREFHTHTQDFKELKRDFQEFKEEFHGFVDFTAKTVATKDDLKEFADKAFKTFATKEDVRRIVEKSEERVLGNWRQVMTSNDEIAKEVKAMRQEQAAHFGSHKRQEEEIGKLKHRVDKVEAHVGII